MELIENQGLITFIQFFSENFEFVVALLFALSVSFVALIITLKFSDPEFRDLSFGYFQSALICIIIFGQGYILYTSGFILLQKAKNPVGVMEYPGDIRTNVAWVTASKTIYYIKGDEFHSIAINGQDDKLLYRSDSLLREFHLSPDGKYVVLNSFEDIILLNRKTLKVVVVDSLESDSASLQNKGVLNGVRWSPGSDSFVYEKSTWSSFTARHKVYIYSLEESAARELKTIPKKIFSLYWDVAGENLYFLDIKAKDVSVYSYPFELKVLRIPVGSLELIPVADIVVSKNDVPLDSLRARGINLYTEGYEYSFARDEIKTQLEKDSNKSLFIDNNDFLNYQAGAFKFTRLFKIPRQPDLSDPSKYQYKGGAFAVLSIRWITGTDFVLITDKNEGVLILTPDAHIIGKLMVNIPDVIGWF